MELIMEIINAIGGVGVTKVFGGYAITMTSAGAERFTLFWIVSAIAAILVFEVVKAIIGGIIRGLTR